MNKIILTKDDVLRAQKHTLSNRAAARYLGVSYNVYKRYALTFVDNESGKTLFDKHLNRQGKGIKKHLGGYGKPKKNIKAPLEDVLEGRVDVSHYTVDILKSRLIQEGFLQECCNSCGFQERRVVDYKVPLGTHDHIIALGSINFNSREDIEARFSHVIDLLMPGGKLYMRVNPGIPHKTGPWVDIFPWSFEVVKELEIKYNLKLETFKKDANSRLYFVYTKC